MKSYNSRKKKKRKEKRWSKLIILTTSFKGLSKQISELIRLESIESIHCNSYLYGA